MLNASPSQFIELPRTSCSTPGRSVAQHPLVDALSTDTYIVVQPQSLTITSHLRIPRVEVRLRNAILIYDGIARVSAGNFVPLLASTYRSWLGRCRRCRIASRCWCLARWGGRGLGLDRRGSWDGCPSTTISCGWLYAKYEDVPMQ